MKDKVLAKAKYLKSVKNRELLKPRTKGVNKHGRKKKHES